MHGKSKKAAAISVAALVAVGGGVGGAVAASGSDPATPKQAYLDDAAQRLGVTPDALQGALKAAALDRVDAAFAAGRITADQASRLKLRIQNRPGAGLGRNGLGGLRGRLGLRRIVKAAADYLDLKPVEILQQLRQGKSLADIAQAQGKTVDGLETTILTPIKTRLDQAVANQRISSDQEQQLLDKLKTRLDTLVNRHFGQPQNP
jgi:hypothetical protein